MREREREERERERESNKLCRSVTSYALVIFKIAERWWACRAMLRKIEICRQCKNKKYAGSAEICRWCRNMQAAQK